MIILILGKKDFKSKSLQDKEWHYILIKMFNIATRYKITNIMNLITDLQNT